MLAASGTRVMVVVEQDLLRFALSDSLRLHGLDVVMQCRSAVAAIQGAAATEPDVALIDVSSDSGADHIALGNTLIQSSPKMGLVYLSSCEDPRLLGADVKLPRGASFVTKDQVRDVHDLAQVISDSLSRRPEKAARPPKLDLTDHQVLILRSVAAGSTNAQIGEEFEVTSKAVEQSISRLAKRLGVHEAGPGNLRVRLANEYMRLTM